MFIGFHGVGMFFESLIYNRQRNNQLTIHFDDECPSLMCTPIEISFSFHPVLDVNRDLKKTLGNVVDTLDKVTHFATNKKKNTHILSKFHHVHPYYKPQIQWFSKKKVPSIPVP